MMEMVKEHHRPDNETKVWYSTYLCLAMTRFLLILSPGYIHPDEFFQGGQEVWAAIVFHLPDCLIPWEFQPQHALRCITFPWLIAGLPFQLLKHVIGPLCAYSGLLADPIDIVRGSILLLLPRFIMVMLSFIQDYCIYHLVLSNFSHQEPWIVLTAFASSWPVLLFSSRPFSNTLESIILAMALAFTFRHPSSSPRGTSASFSDKFRRVILGGILASGCFVRFTFPAFAFPVGVYELMRAISPDSTSAWQRDGKGRRVLIKPLWWCLRDLAVGGLVATLPLIAFDTVFYRGFLFKFFPVIAPLNALLYNVQASNLATHGLHPRITHLLVNVPMLFSSLALITGFNCRRLMSENDPKQPKQKQNEAPTRKFNQSCCHLLLSVVCGVMILSLAPHQEPRFLLPLCVPLALLSGHHLFTNDKSWLANVLRVVWVLQNIILLVFFGFLHQAGVIPSLLRLETRIQSDLLQRQLQASSQVSNALVVYYHTYMPPRFLLAASHNSEHSGTNGFQGLPGVKVIDLAGAPLPDLKLLIHHGTIHDSPWWDSFDNPAEVLPGGWLSNSSSCKSSTPPPPESPLLWYLVSPDSIPLESTIFPSSSGMSVTAAAIQRVYPHLSTEDPPSIQESRNVLKALSLIIYSWEGRVGGGLP